MMQMAKRSLLKTLFIASKEQLRGTVFIPIPIKLADVWFYLFFWPVYLNVVKSEARTFGF